MTSKNVVHKYEYYIIYKLIYTNGREISKKCPLMKWKMGSNCDFHHFFAFLIAKQVKKQKKKFENLVKIEHYVYFGALVQ